MCEVDVFAENVVIIDWETHELWIQGLSVDEAANVMRGRSIVTPSVNFELLLSEMHNHFRLYSMLEHLLLTVGNLSEQLLFQLDESSQQQYIERYYALDARFCREIVGKKLSSRLRKEVDATADKLGMRLKACRRQFDNVKRVFKTIEEMPGNYVNSIKTIFSISQSLSEEYASLVFAVTFRMELGKKKLSSISFSAIRTALLRIMDDLVECNNDNESDFEPAFDRDLLASLKDVKAILQERQTELKVAVCKKLADDERLKGSKRIADVENGFKSLTRSLGSLAHGLGGGKETRELIVNVFEKLVEPMKHQMKLSSLEAEALFDAYLNIMLEEGQWSSIETRKNFEKFIQCLKHCTLALY